MEQAAHSSDLLCLKHIQVAKLGQNSGAWSSVLPLSSTSPTQWPTRCPWKSYKQVMEAKVSPLLPSPMLTFGRLWPVNMEVPFSNCS